MKRGGGGGGVCDGNEEDQGLRGKREMRGLRDEEDGR